MALKQEEIIKEANKSKALLLEREEMNDLISLIIGEYTVYGPVRNEKNEKMTKFDRVFSPDEIEWEYGLTTLPPKKYLIKPFENLFLFNKEGEITSEVDDAKGKQVLFGLHPCDVKGIQVLDKVFSKENEDPNYMQRRNNTIIVALSCYEVRSTCFCTSFDAGPYIKDGYDILITKLGGRFLIEIGSEKGQEIIDLLGELSEEAVYSYLLDEYFRLKAARLETLYNRIKKGIDLRDITGLLEVSVNSRVWDELAERCLFCGTCSVVCPTCFCFSVKDEVDITLEEGGRYRVWDSCLLLEFAEVALGENFREEGSARVRQRIYHKFYAQEFQFDEIGCVGCGRCIKFCLKKIDPREVINDLRRERYGKG